MRKKFFKILIILGLTGISFLFSSHFAFAFFLVDWAGKAVIWTCGKLAFLFGWLAAVVISLENCFRNKIDPLHIQKGRSVKEKRLRV